MISEAFSLERPCTWSPRCGNLEATQHIELGDDEGYGGFGSILCGFVL
jgi:hypothetical protein